MEALRQGDRLTGRYHAVDQPRDTGPCVFRIVGPDRLDGSWPSGRWDFRRRLK
jgi:hypothetical protein